MRTVVLDTNVVAAARSREGASFLLLQELLGKPRFHICLSVPLAMEYEMAVKRAGGLKPKDAEGLVDFLCDVADRREIFFLWRPSLRDPKDEMVLEVAVEASADTIVTHNVRDFAGVEDGFGIRVIRPGALLLELERGEQ